MWWSSKNTAEKYSVPYLPPYLTIVESLKLKGEHGVNFAVAGATALDSKFFYDQGIGQALWTNHSLTTQLGWFKQLKSTMCTTKQGNKYGQRVLESILIVLNDFTCCFYLFIYFFGLINDLRFFPLSCFSQCFVIYLLFLSFPQVYLNFSNIF